MNIKKYKQIRAAVALFVSLVVSISVVKDSYFLSLAGVLTGMIFLLLVRSKVKITIDEREKDIREKAAQFTYAIFAPTLGITSLLMMLPSSGALKVFANGDFIYLESLGTVFAYLTLFLISIYAVSYHYLNKKYGGDGDDE